MSSIRHVRTAASSEWRWWGRPCSRTARRSHSPARTQKVTHTFHLSFYNFTKCQDVNADGAPVSLLCCCSRDHSECTGLQEGRGTVARRPDGETHLKDRLPYAFISVLISDCSPRDVPHAWFPLSVSPSECDEHDARNQHPLRPDESQPSVLDPEGLPVQRWHKERKPSPLQVGI